MGEKTRKQMYRAVLSSLLWRLLMLFRRKVMCWLGPAAFVKQFARRNSAGFRQPLPEIKSHKKNLNKRLKESLLSVWNPLHRLSHSSLQPLCGFARQGQLSIAREVSALSGLCSPGCTPASRATSSPAVGRAAGCGDLVPATG